MCRQTYEGYLERVVGSICIAPDEPIGCQTCYRITTGELVYVFLRDWTYLDL